jgi:hypothetical protein
MQITLFANIVIGRSPVKQVDYYDKYHHSDECYYGAKTDRVNLAARQLSIISHFPVTDRTKKLQE